MNEGIKINTKAIEQHKATELAEMREWTKKLTTRELICFKDDYFAYLEVILDELYGREEYVAMERERAISSNRVIGQAPGTPPGLKKSAKRRIKARN